MKTPHYFQLKTTASVKVMVNYLNILAEKYGYITYFHHNPKKNCLIAMFWPKSIN